MSIIKRILAEKQEGKSILRYRRYLGLNRAEVARHKRERDTEKGDRQQSLFEDETNELPLVVSRP